MIVAGGREAWREDQIDGLLVGHGGDRRLRRRVALAGDFADPGHVDPAAVILDLDHHVLALALRPQMDRRRGRLAERGPLRGVLQPVVQPVAQDMKQGLGDRLDDRLVGLGRGAFDHEARRLAERGGHFPDEAGEALEGVLQRQHPQAEHRALELADQAVEREMLVLERDSEGSGIAVALRTLGRMADGVLGDQQLAGQSHEGVDTIDIDTQRGFRRLRGQRAGLLGRWLGQPLENAVDGLDHGLGIAGDQAALQRAFEIRRVQRPAMMAQHVGRDAACRIRAVRRPRFRRRLGEHQLLRLEKVASDGRQAGGILSAASSHRQDRAGREMPCRARRVWRSGGRGRRPRHRHRPESRRSTASGRSRR